MARCSVAEGRDYIAKCKPTQIKTGAICLHVYIKSAFIAAPSPSSQTATFLKQCKVMKKWDVKEKLFLLDTYTINNITPIMKARR